MCPKNDQADANTSGILLGIFSYMGSFIVLGFGLCVAGQVFDRWSWRQNFVAVIATVQDEEDEIDDLIGELQNELRELQQRILEDNKLAR